MGDAPSLPGNPYPASHPCSSCTSCRVAAPGTAHTAHGGHRAARGAVGDQPGGLCPPWLCAAKPELTGVHIHTVTPGQGCVMKEHTGTHPKPLAQHHRDNGNNNNHPNLIKAGKRAEQRRQSGRGMINNERPRFQHLFWSHVRRQGWIPAAARQGVGCRKSHASSASEVLLCEQGLSCMGAAVPHGEMSQPIPFPRGDTVSL